MKKLFGTDGMRGEAGQFPLDEATVYVVGQSLAGQFREKNKGRPPRFILGRDTRESGTWIEAAVCAGAENGGAECISAGVITTPGVAFLTGDQKADAGIVISASHNPFYDNGIKIFSPTGRKIDGATERKIEADISSHSDFGFRISDSTSSSAVKKTNDDLQQRYLNYLAGEFSNLSLHNLKIVIDCANGAASNLAPKLFETFGANVIAIFNHPNGRNINTDCGSLHLEKMRSQVLEKKADFGVAFDGDADRALFVDADGNLVDGDATLWIMAQHLQAVGVLEKETVVATSMSNLGLELALKARHIKLVRTDVGDKYVLEELLKSETSLGGEQSGHIIFPKRSLVGDGMLTALSILEVMQTRRARLSDLTAGFVRFPQILLNVRVREKQDLNSVSPIATVIKAVEDELGERGRLVLRYSGTEPLARVMIEGESQAVINNQAQRIARVIEQELGCAQAAVQPQLA